ncbi:hypothetical protein MWU50_05760 [Flavobacteriaceae bacterium S0862]|nr:hypothetical protein [Flavobacteriaceae bacterium S0862]
MSTNLPEQQPSEEIDLGQLFKLIGNAFDRFFRFIGSIFNKFFLAFVWVVFFTKKHFIKLVIALLVGVGLGFLKKLTETPIYESTIVLRQNYNTGEHLNNTIQYYNSLIGQKDSVEISKIFKLPVKQASKITELVMESNLTENQKMILFDEYTKELDSARASEIEFKEFIENSKDYDYDIQKLTLKSSVKTNFNQTLLNIVESIENSEFYKKEKEKLIGDLNSKDSVILSALTESKALQEVYKNVLEKSVEDTPSGATTSITVGDAKDKNITKEYELFIEDLELKRELVENKLKRKNLEEIIEVISIQNGDGTIDNQAKLFGIETSWTVALAIKISGILYLILLLMEFIRFLERYKDKVQ